MSYFILDGNPPARQVHAFRSPNDLHLLPLVSPDLSFEPRDVSLTQTVLDRVENTLHTSEPNLSRVGVPALAHCRAEPSLAFRLRKVLV